MQQLAVPICSSMGPCFAYVFAMQRGLRSVPIETNLVRKGLLRVGRESGPVDARDLLGTVKASERLSLTDLDVLGWLSSRLLREESAVSFSRDELAVDLFGRRPGGRERQLVQASLERLSTVRVTLGGYDAMRRATDLDGAFVDVQILTGVHRLPPAGYAQPSWKVEFADWLLAQLAHGHATYADWATLRTLTGLQKRMWLYFEAEPRDAFWISLGTRGLTSLGVASRSAGAARNAIVRATHGLDYYDARIRRTRAGYRLHVRRIRSQPGLFHFGRRPAQRQWIRLDGPRRRAPTFDPNASLIGSKVGGNRRNEREAMARPARSPHAEILFSGDLPDDQVELLVWAREEGRSFDQVLIRLERHPSDVRMDITGRHNPGCPDLDAALEDSDLDGIFVVGDGPRAIERWCEQRLIPKPRWCATCRTRFHEQTAADSDET